MAQEEIDLLKVVISNLEALGSILFQSEIDSMKQKLADLEAELLIEIQALEVKVIEGAPIFGQEIKTEVVTIKTEVVSFYEKYRTDINVTTVILIMHIIGKFGW